MRTFTRLSFSLLAAIVLPLALWANVIVKGTVKYNNGQPAANYEVHIESDSIPVNPGSPCPQSHVKRTNANGFYQDTLICNATMAKVIVWVVNCDGNIIRKYLPVTTSGVVECNFEVCMNVACKAKFGWSRIATSPLGIAITDSSSAGANNDSIISRKWSFGDGTYDSTSVNPTHTYAQPGVYNVCLRIKTRNNCVSEICKTVQVGNNDCHPEFTFEAAASNANLIKFNSAPSTISPNDSIISRKWTFGDGTSLDGNVIAPQHQYANAGSYTVCLTTKTKLGCEKTVCKPIVFGQVSCHADFIHEVLAPTSNTGRSVKFRSQSSSTSPQDSIVSRKWKFGDGTSLDGNVIEPIHVYQQPGTYNVCLYITSARGCKDSVCKQVVVPVTNTVCRAEWNHEVLPTITASGATTVRFNSQQSSSASGDSIVNRLWKFGDGASLSGNVTNPLHTYLQPGTYTVCLYITSARGCKDSVCKPVVIQPITFRCQPRFSHFATGLSVKFKSAPTQIAPGDSIINRYWTFGDGTNAGNLAEPTHQYTRSGEFEVCLRIQTRSGCMETWCKKIAVVSIPGNCVPYFTPEQIGGTVRTMRFNSAAAYSQLPGDSIIERKWTFGDGATLGGNIVNPTHQYNTRGAYTVCLQLKTRLGCDTKWCREVLVQGTDSSNTTEAVKIVNLYPVPVRTTLNATIWSRYNNVNSTLAIYDVYGVMKWSQNKLLTMGNSNHQIPVSQLANGPYIFKITTIYGVVSRNFFKVQ
jgi:PKD repeat protein